MKCCCKALLFSLAFLFLGSACEPPRKMATALDEGAAANGANIITPVETPEEPAEDEQLPPLGGPPRFAGDGDEEELKEPTRPSRRKPDFDGGREHDDNNESLKGCEKGTSDCNDNNPCSVDSCNDSDECVHTLDETKSNFGSCEVDGNSCTVGKCLEVNAEIICHEESRAFLDEPLGCNDENDCTSDSCVVTPLAGAQAGEQMDEQGNVILDNEPQCISEVMNGVLCFMENQCAFGVCMESGIGVPGDEFSVNCVESGEHDPQPFCPSVFPINPCVMSICTMGSGCSVVNVPDDTVCDDGNSCTTSDTCESGVCRGTDTICNDDIACTRDICDGGGGCLNLPDSGLCPSSNSQCQQNLCSASLGCTLTNEEVGTLCSDGNPCTIEDSCDTQGSCVAGSTLNCADDDVNDCSIPSCDTHSGCIFSNATKGSPCLADGSVCTLDMCNETGDCILGTPIVCADDGNPCTAESCDPKLGCIYPAGNNNAPCTDFNACTTHTTCKAGNCSGGIDVICDDNNVCTVESCSIIGGCMFSDITGPFGSPCEISDAVGVCQTGLTVCASGVELTDRCAPIFQPGDQVEVCGNGLDDDCNGEADESFCDCPEVPVGNKIFYVLPKGSDNNDCLSEKNPCETIEHAIDLASSGDGIVLLAGTFNESGIDLIGKDLNIVGRGVNSSIVDGGNATIFFVDGATTLSICGVTFQNASTVVKNTGELLVWNSSFINNTPNDGTISNSGRLTISTSLFDNNASMQAGAIMNGVNAVGFVTNSTFTNNSAQSDGGAIVNLGQLTITNSTISTNTAANGGGLNSNSGTTTIVNSTIDNNDGTVGGGLFIAFATATIENSTISGNDATNFGGGIAIGTSGNVTINNSTLTGNTATSMGGGISNEGVATLFHTIIANSVGDDCGNISLPIDGGFNLDEDGSCLFSTTSADPNLGPLANNGGPTQTHALIPPSPAIDAGDVTCGVTTNQLGSRRPVDFQFNDPTARCDIGAYERQN